MPIIPTFRVLCAMARAEIVAAPTITDGEWVERIKLRLARQRFAYPPPHHITDAIRAVERACAKQWGPRPAPMLRG
jgi:hypothetical protein